RVYQTTQLDPRLGEAQEISIYDLGANGLPVSRTDARQAKYVGDGVWELDDPVRTEISEHGLSETPAAPRARLGEAPSEPLDTKQLGALALVREIRDAEANGYNATPYRVDFHVKLAAPFTCLLLPAAAFFFAIGGPPFPGPALTILIGSVLGVGHILLTGVCASLGYGGFLPPSLAGWAPSAGLTALIGVLARRSHGGQTQRGTPCKGALRSNAKRLSISTATFPALPPPKNCAPGRLPTRSSLTLRRSTTTMTGS